MHKLVLHPGCAPGSVHTIEAEVTATSDGCRATFIAHGDIARIAVPVVATPGRFDNLWKTTCFEIFWQPIGGTYYREFNLSPSGRWAAYDFDSFREGMRDAPVDAISLSTSMGSVNGRGELVLRANIATDLPAPAQVALNAIVEHRDGGLQFWALAFAPGKAEFHSEACRQLIIERD